MTYRATSSNHRVKLIQPRKPRRGEKAQANRRSSALFLSSTTAKSFESSSAPPFHFIPSSAPPLEPPALSDRTGGAHGEVRAAQGHRVRQLRGGAADAEQGDQGARRHEVHPTRAQGACVRRCLFGCPPPPPPPLIRGSGSRILPELVCLILRVGFAVRRLTRMWRGRYQPPVAAAPQHHPVQGGE
jgi:hypothetical protein